MQMIASPVSDGAMAARQPPAARRSAVSGPRLSLVAEFLTRGQTCYQRGTGRGSFDALVVKGSTVRAALPCTRRPFVVPHLTPSRNFDFRTGHGEGFK